MKPPLPTLLLAATLCASGLLMPAARAQSLNPKSLDPARIDQPPILRTPMMREVVRDFKRRVSASAAQKGLSGLGKTPAKALVATTYRESPAVAKRVAVGFIHWKLIQAQGDAMETAYLRRDLEEGDDGGGRRESWAAGFTKAGLKRGDVADALAGYWLMNWLIANRVKSDPKPAQVRAVRNLFASVLRSNPAFARTTNAQRQEIAEAAIYNTSFQGADFLQAIYGESQVSLKQFSDARAASFKKEMGFDLRTVKLTNTGFAAK